MGNFIKDAVDKLVGMTPAPAVSKGLSTGASGNATSGLDTAMSAHADQQHPLSPAAQKYKLRLPSDE